MKKRHGTAPAHPKRADLLGRFKNGRHGTGHFTSWVTEQRVSQPWPSHQGRHVRKHGRRQPG